MRHGKGIRFWESLTHEEIQEFVHYFPSRNKMAKALGLHAGLKSYYGLKLADGSLDLNWGSRREEIELSEREVPEQYRIFCVNRVHCPNRTEESSAWLTTEVRRKIGETHKSRAKKRFIEEILPFLFVKNSKFDGSTARAFIRHWNKEFGWLEYKCATEGCPAGLTWLGKEITLQIDHKNGDSRDHRLENLRHLCPNCHSQTETFAGRNKASCRAKAGKSPRVNLDSLPENAYREWRDPKHKRNLKLDPRPRLERGLQSSEDCVLPVKLTGISGAHSQTRTGDDPV